MQLDDLIRSGRRTRLYDPTDAQRVELGRAEVERLLPHRDPFRFVDMIDAVDLAGGHIAGRYRLDPANPLFVGHFPGDPIFPGVLQVEAMGQLGLCLFALAKDVAEGRAETPRAVRGLKIHHAVFLDAIRPGAELRLIAKELESNDYTGVCAGQVIVGDTICCFAVMEVYFVQA